MSAATTDPDEWPTAVCPDCERTRTRHSRCPECGTWYCEVNDWARCILDHKS